MIVWKRNSEAIRWYHAINLYTEAKLMNRELAWQIFPNLLRWGMKYLRGDRCRLCCLWTKTAVLCPTLGQCVDCFFRGEMKFGPMDVPLWDIFGTTRFLPLFSELGWQKRTIGKRKHNAKEGGRFSDESKIILVRLFASGKHRQELLMGSAPPYPLDWFVSLTA